MPIDKAAIADRLKKFDFTGVFTQELGWDFAPPRLQMSFPDLDVELRAVAQKRGMVVFLSQGRPGGNAIPDYPTRRRIDRMVSKSHFEHLVIYTDTAQTTQVWQWVRVEHGKPAASREHVYHKSQPGDALIQKLQRIAFTLDEEENLTVVDVAGRVRSGFDVEKVTKRFYDRFKAEHAVFAAFLKGIPDQSLHRWYVSVMLNRLMFIYFVQKKGFLDNDRDYLRHRLAQMVPTGKDRFYRDFLCPLFFEGFACREADRSAATNELLGKVPYLDGGLFLRHQIEELHGQHIQISDAAFEKVFAFFDAYQWHLDERPLRRDDEINPDVLGYIFEKYINQKQMGAYYTKEDITEYISKNTIIPFLFDHARQQPGCADAFAAGGCVWRLLAENPDRYIYAAMRKGVIDGQGNVIPLPPRIEVGVADVSRRGGWNRPAEADYALPTETWREHVARRQRCLEIREKLKAGQIADINDLITLNLDIRQFAQDVIADCESLELLRAFYAAIEKVTVLDPTCGSGAFLFAALGILEPLYEACIERMESFVSGSLPVPSILKPAVAALRSKMLGEHASAARFADFKHVLDRIAKHANPRHFILKSIIVTNLFGVDIMEEAVEICKLRLFLKLVAQIDRVDQIEPLPDIDFNIRAGNTLVGYASEATIKAALEYGSLDFAGAAEKIAAKAQAVEHRFAEFREKQLAAGRETSSTLTRSIKQAILKPLNELRHELDQYLASGDGIAGERKFQAWRQNHQPFHWVVEFYGIIKEGGFAVIIGNPPYISAAKVRKEYTVSGMRTDSCPDIYAWVLERAAALVAQGGRTGMIVPLSLGFSGDFAGCRELLYRAYGHNWFSSFGRIPAALFNFDVRVRNTIHLGHRSRQARANFTTRLHRWFDVERPSLLPLMEYSAYDPCLWGGRVPKIGKTELCAAFERAIRCKRGMVNDLMLDRRATSILHFKKTAYNWINFCRQLPPCFEKTGKPIPHTQFDIAAFADVPTRDLCFLLLNGKLVYCFWAAVGDDFHVARWMFSEFPLNPAHLPHDMVVRLRQYVAPLEKAMAEATSFKLNAGKNVGNYNLARCRHITDHSDRIFAEHLGIAGVWDQLELYYSQIVKTDFDDEE